MASEAGVKRRGLWFRRPEVVYQTPAEAARAQRQREINQQFKKWSTRRMLAWALFTTAAVIVVQHMFAHLGWQPLPMSMGWQDLFFGYPMAAVVFVAGLLVLDRRAPR